MVISSIAHANFENFHSGMGKWFPAACAARALSFALRSFSDDGPLEPVQEMAS